MKGDLPDIVCDFLGLGPFPCAPTDLNLVIAVNLELAVAACRVNAPVRWPFG